MNVFYQYYFILLLLFCLLLDYTLISTFTPFNASHLISTPFFFPTLSLSFPLSPLSFQPNLQHTIIITIIITINHRSTFVMSDSQKDFQKDLDEVEPAPRYEGALPNITTFNMEYGFIEAFLRGLRSGFLSKAEYRQITTVETIDDFKTCLQDTDYVNALQGLQSPRPQVIYKKCFEKFVREFEWVRSQLTGQLAAFFDLITFEYQISNVIAMISATIKGTPVAEVLEHCHPLGRSPYLKSMLTFEKGDNLLELYRIVIVDMPIAKYFTRYFEDVGKSKEPEKVLFGNFKENDINVISGHLRKIWLEDFYQFCSTLGGETWTIMKELLDFEVDRRAIEIVHNSIAVKSYLNDNNSRPKRQELFCTFGQLYPDCTGQLSTGGGPRNFTRVDNDLALASAIEPYPVYREAHRKASEKTMSLSDALKYTEVDLLKKAFDGQGHFACFYAWVKLKLVELENIRSISSALSFRARPGQESKKPPVKYIPIF